MLRHSFILGIALLPRSSVHASFFCDSVQRRIISTTQPTFPLNQPRSRCPSAEWTVDKTRAAHGSLLASSADNSVASSSPRQYVSQGMQAFRQGQVDDSIRLFDQAEALGGPRLSPFLWQRGLSYYYAQDFDKARGQFRTDVRVNPVDVEEIVWDIASALRLQPNAFPVPDALVLPAGRQDSRRIMGVVYRLFRGDASEKDLAMAGHAPDRAPSDDFYALFYLGLYNEVRQNSSKASHYMRDALATNYAKGLGRGDYMTDVCRIHCQLRGWLN